MQGRADISSFEVTTSGHAMAVNGYFRSVVNGENGDVSLESVSAHFLHSTINAKGAICSMPGQSGKTATLELSSKIARVEDLLRMFTKADPSALRGPLAFRAHVKLPPDHREFLRKISLNGDFEIKPASFSRPKTIHEVDELSRHARGLKEEQTMPVTSELKSRASLRDGIAYLSNSSFEVPGAKANGAGTYGLITKDIHLAGTLALQSSLSKAAGGAKSLLLLPLNPFFKKPDLGAVLPFRITGTYPNPKFYLSLKIPKATRR